MMSIQDRKRRQSGTALLVTIIAMVWLVIPIAGLAIDTGSVYVTKTRLQAAVDGCRRWPRRALCRLARPPPLRPAARSRMP